MTLNMRKHYIDNLRWLILLILIPYHAAQAWNTWGAELYFFEGNRAISSIIVFFSPYFYAAVVCVSRYKYKICITKEDKKRVSD